MRRIFLVLAVAALMAAMMVVSVSPAFAKKEGQAMVCIKIGELSINTSLKQVIKDLERDGYTCIPN